MRKEDTCVRKNPEDNDSHGYQKEECQRKSWKKKFTTAIKAFGLAIVGCTLAGCLVKLVIFQERLDLLQNSSQHEEARIRTYVDGQIAIILEQVGSLRLIIDCNATH